EFFAGEIVAIHASRPEADDDTLAVGDGGGVTIRIALPALFLLAVLDVRLPKLLAVASAQALEAANTSVRCTHREKKLVAPDNRRRVSGMVEQHLPLDVFLAAPLHG